MARNYQGRSLPHIVTDSTGFLLSWVAADATARFESSIAEAGLTSHQLGVLSALRGGPQMPARMSEQLAVFKPVMVTLLNELEAMGLVERRPHPSDRRAHEIHLLPAGADRLRAADELIQRSSEQMFAALTDRERDQLHATLLKLAHLQSSDTSAPRSSAPRSSAPDNTYSPSPDTPEHPA